MPNLTITNANVNGGNAVTVIGGKVTYSWENLTKPVPIPGNYDTVESNFGGFENPKIVITGVIDADNLGVIANHLNMKLLIDLAIEKSATTTLKLQVGNTNLTGTTTSTSASKLVNSGAAFTSNLIGMYVFNSTDNTGTIITTVDSVTTLSVRNDIFTSGEGYIIKSIIGGRPASGYVTTGNNQIDIEDGVDIQIEGFTLGFDASASAKSNRIEVTITCHETT